MRKYVLKGSFAESSVDGRVYAVHVFTTRVQDIPYLIATLIRSGHVAADVRAIGRIYSGIMRAKKNQCSSFTFDPRIWGCSATARAHANMGWAEVAAGWMIKRAIRHRNLLDVKLLYHGQNFS